MILLPLIMPIYDSKFEYNYVNKYFLHDNNYQIIHCQGRLTSFDPSLKSKQIFKYLRALEPKYDAVKFQKLTRPNKIPLVISLF